MVKVGGRDIPGDLVVIGTGLLVFVLSFIDFFNEQGFGANGYEVGFLSSAGIALAVFAALLAAARVFLGMSFASGSPVGPAVLIAGISTLGAVLLVLKLIIGYHSVDRAVGLYLVVVVAIVQAVFAVLTMLTSGEKLPDFKRPAAAS